MTATTETLKLVAPDTEASTAVAASAPVLITVQEVAFSTAAAMPVLPTTRRSWAGSGCPRVDAQDVPDLDTRRPRAAGRLSEALWLPGAGQHVARNGSALTAHSQRRMP